MNVVDTVIKIAAALTALTVCVTLVVKIHRAVDFIKDAYKMIQDDHLSTLRLTIVSTEMPISERIAAGDKYIEAGGNGAVKHLYEVLIEEYAKEEKLR